MRIRLTTLLLVLIVGMTENTPAQNGREAVNYYALASLEDKGAGERLAARFKAQGEPVFLIHNPNVGVTQGDIMRFRDKAVLIDADVWQTLKTEGAFASLKSAPLVKVQARAATETWKSRAQMVASPAEKKAYHFGARLIEALEENFEVLPDNRQLVIQFEDRHLRLLAPAELLAQLTLRDIRRVPSRGKPHIVSLPPERGFVGRDFFWQAWAVDPTVPSEALAYSLQGDLPEGLVWDAKLHALKGRPGASGKWPLRLTARNEKGGTDTLRFTLETRLNALPRLAQAPDARAVAGKPWRFEAAIVDHDHAGASVSMEVLQMPEGMRFDASNRTLLWENPRGAKNPDSLQPLVLALTDPEGGRTVHRFSLSVQPSDDWILSQGLHSALPWDTLRQGRRYEWNAAASLRSWAERELILEEVTGDDSTHFSDGMLTVKPKSGLAHVLSFHFTENGQPLEHRLVFEVAPNRPPVFTSEVGVAHIRTQEHASYRPLAHDPDGDSLFLDARLPEAGPFRWDGARLHLLAEAPGLYAAELIARDAMGNIGSQRVAYRVMPGNPLFFTTEHRWLAGLSLWNASMTLGQGRVGIFIPDLRRQVGWREWSEQEWPFVYFGSNLYPHNPMVRSRERRSLWVDLGMTLRVPDPKLITGGILARLQGHWQFPSGFVQRVELEMHASVHQAIVLTDTTGLHFTGIDSGLALGRRFLPHARRITRDATAKENTVFISRLEAWRNMNHGMWTGIGLWREDLPMRGEYSQRVGTGLRYEAQWAGFGVRNTLRGGWGPDGAGWALQWNSELGFGRN